MIAHRTALATKPAPIDARSTYKKPTTGGSEVGTSDIHPAIVGENRAAPARQTKPGSRNAMISPKFRSSESLPTVT
jgi:hypothetical protein